jgi:hypothetical protein
MSMCHDCQQQQTANNEPRCMGCNKPLNSNDATIGGYAGVYCGVECLVRKEGKTQSANVINVK